MTKLSGILAAVMLFLLQIVLEYIFSRIFYLTMTWLFSKLWSKIKYVIKILNEKKEKMERKMKERERLPTTVFEWISSQNNPDDVANFTTKFHFKNVKGETLEQFRIRVFVEPILPIFVKSNGDVKFTDKNKRTILHYCISYMEDSNDVGNIDFNKAISDLKLIRILCEIGASIIASDCDGETPLGIALKKNRIDLVTEMLKYDYSSSKNALDQTILHILIENHDSQNRIHTKMIVEFLTEVIDMNKRDKYGLAPIHLAAKSFNIDLLKKFNVYRINLHFRTNIGDDLLVLACKGIMKETDEKKVLCLITWLLDRGFKLDTKNNLKFTPLHYASQFDNLIVIESLVGSGVDLNAVADDNTSPLHSAVMSNSLGVMEYFVEKGVDLYRRDVFYGFSLIHMASLNYNEKNLMWLIVKGFDANDRGNCDLTPLHLASMIGNAKVVKMLTQCGAHVNFKDKTCSHTALHLAAMGGKLYATYIKYINVKLSTRTKFDENSSLVSHCFNTLKLKQLSKADYKATVIALLKAGADVNSRDFSGCMPLHYAMRQSDCDIVEVLLEAGAYFDIPNTEGYTPLHSCLLYGNEEKLNCMLMFGANINDIEHSNENIFEKIIHPRNSNEIRLIENLLKLKSADLPMYNDYKSYVTYLKLEDCSIRFRDNLIKINDIQKKYMGELMKMKKRMLIPDVSLYDLLHMNFKGRLNFAESLPSDLETEFPHYYVIVKGKCKEAVNRKPLIEPAKIAYQLLTGLPHLCVESIISYSSNRTLRAVINSVEEIQCFDAA